VFDTVLIANRGEIAVRVTRTLRALGIRSVAVFSDADAGGRHVREADVAVRLGPAPARESYLSIDRLLAAAAATGAQAIHPGYGFLAENADFARACAAAGIVFIGPPVDAIAVMGDKIRAKLAVGAAGVPVVPGLTEPGLSDAALLAGAAGVGYPLLIKPSAGGGGKGMHVVTDPARLREEIASARREAAASFGDDTLFLERYLRRPRHIEVQVLADAHGSAVHLGERECSLQRRHQKVIEEAPSPLLDEAGRDRIGVAAVETARSVGYTGVGTVEFIVAADAPDEFFFMEMNTRLQVEHPVTEMITGLDLVEQQLRVAAGERLTLNQQGVTLRGHAVEARLYAEDPAHGFLPTGGKVLALREPDGAGVRLDSSVAHGDAVGTSYDPMLAKVIAWGQDRPEALARLDAALAQTAVLGVQTNTAFLRALLAHPDVLAGRLDTGLIERELDGLVSAPVPAAAYAAWGAARFGSLSPHGPVVDPWEVSSGWRQTGPAETVWRVAVGDADEVEVGVTPGQVRVGGGPALPYSLTPGSLTYDGTVRPLEVCSDGPLTWLWLEGRTYVVRELAAQRVGGAASAGDGALRSPMPGSVVAVRAAIGDRVAAGEPLLVVEAMKMEHALLAPFDGSVVGVAVGVGDQVVVGQVLAVVVRIEEES
jgi:acetyl-CoA/propionyl-CoA carboxylase biotin carboxyl carrier protein